MRRVLQGAVAALGALSCLAEQPATAPSPELSPRQVVQAQLHALQHNDEPTPDAGIRTAFRFASPANRGMTGPLARFIEMLKNPHYRPLLHHRRAALSETTLKDDLARIKVTLLDERGEQAAFVWILRRQQAPPCAGCWMTDVVMRVAVKDSPFKVAAAGRAVQTL